MWTTTTTMKAAREIYDKLSTQEKYLMIGAMVGQDFCAASETCISLGLISDDGELTELGDAVFVWCEVLLNE